MTDGLEWQKDSYLILSGIKRPILIGTLKITMTVKLENGQQKIFTKTITVQ